jgi:hypothetical protein
MMIEIVFALTIPIAAFIAYIAYKNQWKIVDIF